MLGAAVAFVLGALAALALVAWLERRARGSAPGPEGGRMAAAPRERTQDALLAAFRPEELGDPTDALREDQRILADALRDIAKRRGATAAVLWQLDQTTGGVAAPVASSADDARSSLTPAFLPVIGPRERERIEFAAHERRLAVDQVPGIQAMVIAPLDAQGEPGALTLHFTAETLPDAEAVREWLPAHAAAMQALYALVRTRADVSRQNLRLRGLIRTALTLQSTRDPLELERLLVVDSLTVAAAEWAVLVRWDERTATGTARGWTGLAARLGVDFEAHAIDEGSLVGQVCRDGRPQVFADARHLARGEDPVFGAKQALAPIGSLLVVPLRRSEQERPLGALVCGHREVAALRAIEARNAKNLAVIAAGALETAWTVEDARRNARTDPLTGIANRRGFDERYARVIDETDRYGGTAALVLMDIDHFKRVNDTYGHDAGDTVLKAVAAVLAEGRRTVDLAARLGGEEMVVLLPQTDAAGAREVAERLRRRIEGLAVRTTVGEVRVTASFGVGEYAARVGTAAAVVERADQALYAAKRNGRNRVEVVA